MFDTRPDLDSYLLTARRLWWVPVALVVVALVTLRPAAAEDTRVAEAVLQVPAPLAVSVTGASASLYDPRSEASALAGAFDLVDPDAEDGSTFKAEGVVRPGLPTIDYTFDAPDEAAVDARMEALNSALAEQWTKQMTPIVNPLRSWAESRSASAAAQLAELEGAPGDGAVIERSQLVTRQSQDLALIDLLDAVLEQPPSAALVSDEEASADGFLVPAAIRIAVALFLAAGVVVAVTLVDRRVRRRSVIERNGLTVVAVDDLAGERLSVVPLALEAATDGSPGRVVVAGIGSTDSSSPVVAALSADDAIGEVDLLSEPFVSDDAFAKQIAGAGAAVLVADAGRTRYADLFEAARVSVAAGAENVCVVIIAKGRRALSEARS